MSERENVDTKDLVRRVLPSDVVASPLNPRRRFLQSKLVEMADSIRAHGVIQPLKCRERADGKLEVIFGERRWRGAMMVSEGYGDHDAQDLFVPVLVEQMDDQTAFELMLMENLVRDDLSHSEKARGYEKLMTDFGLSARGVAERVGVPRRSVDRSLALLELPNVILERLDDNELPLYAALEALRVPAEWQSGDARMNALALAEEAGSAERAHELVEARWLRPARERADWESEERAEALRKEFGSEVEVLDYRESRGLFPVGTTVLTAVTAGKYVAADVVPDVPDVRRVTKESWGDMARKFGAPLYVACDGAMNAVLLTKSDLVAEAARLAFTVQVNVVDDVEGGSGLMFEAEDVEMGDEVVFSVMSHGGALPTGYSAAQVYFVCELAGNRFRVKESSGVAKTMVVKDEGKGSTEHMFRMVLLNLTRCPFGPEGHRVSNEVSKTDQVDSSKEEEGALKAKAAEAAVMVGELEMAIRIEVDAGNGNDVLLAKSARFLFVAGAVGYSHDDFPGHHLMLALEKPDEAEEGGNAFAGWEGLDGTRAGLESFCVCAHVLYFLDMFEGEKLRDCPQWRDAAGVYGLL